MSTTTLRDAALGIGAGRKDEAQQRRALLDHAMEHAAHMLPAQGPINVFIHHNTLHAFEELPFDEAVVAGGKVFDCEPYLSEERFRERLSAGRIRDRDLREVVSHDLGSRRDESIAALVKLSDLRLA